MMTPPAPWTGSPAATSLAFLLLVVALAPFRPAVVRPETDPQRLPYLDGVKNSESGQLDITMEVLIQTSKMRAAGEAPTRLTIGLASQAAYWTAAQLVAHHTVNGCNLRTGDLFGSGTLSGPTADSAGSLLELTQGGKTAIELPNGEKRTFLQDGDAIVLRGWCEKPGRMRIGFGHASGVVERA